eukprot:TRINITY_DN35740_c0_g1_i1.p1 TRINITY_DN35740_c0_g1~~TRINITY_DN35740_c0_g1_i1.p1  ORF type:complete len:532 (+),score=154.54 TRINITY_DN35740_c0_g1_i1:132-1727(+)
MNPAVLDLCGGIINDAYVKNSRQAYARVESAVKSLVAQRRLPENGWSDEMIQHVLDHLALMDSNNYVGNVGGGEREGRVFSNLVKRRHFGMAHGIGRSGDLLANQPKAAGSSIVYALCNLLALDVLRIAGATRTKQAMVVPSATGMGLSLVLNSLDDKVPEPAGAPQSPSQSRRRKRWVVWSRIDQKTCLKCIYSCGFEAKVVPLKPVPGGPGLHGTDLQAMEQAILECGGPANVLCVLSTTSCFAPRIPDDVLGIARLCKRMGVPHIVNNAYGVQSSRIMRSLNAAMEHGRVDAFVQSTDKNFMVPIGGSVVASDDAAMVQRIGAVYPGRASAAPVQDLFITLLSMGRRGWRRLVEEREQQLARFHRCFADFARAKAERIVTSERNDISFCLTLNSIPPAAATSLGSALFYHCVSGPRVVPAGVTKQVCGLTFRNYGSHSDDVDFSYLTLACAIGVQPGDAEELVERVGKAWTRMLKELQRRHRDKPQPPPAAAAPAHADDDGPKDMPELLDDPGTPMTGPAAPPAAEGP